MIIKIYLKNKIQFSFLFTKPLLGGCQGPLAPLIQTQHRFVLFWIILNQNCEIKTSSINRQYSHDDYQIENIEVKILISRWITPALFPARFLKLQVTKRSPSSISFQNKHSEPLGPYFRCLKARRRCSEWYLESYCQFRRRILYHNRKEKV